MATPPPDYGSLHSSDPNHGPPPPPPPSPPPPPITSEFCEKQLVKEVALKSTGPNGKLDLNEAIELCGFGTFQWLYMFLFGVIYLSDAAEIALSGIILPTLMCEWRLSTLQEGLIPFMVLISYAVGSVVGGKLSDKHGRKRVMMFMLPLLVIFSILSAFAPEFYTFIIFRSVVGFSIGSNTASVTTFAMEIVPVSNRAFAMFLINIWFVLGGCYEYTLGLFLMNTFGWRVIVLITAIPTLIACIAAFFIVESPRFLLVSGRREEVERVVGVMCWMNRRRVPALDLPARAVEEVRGSLEELMDDRYFRITVLLTQAFSINMFVEYGALLLLPDMFVYDYCSDSSLFESTTDQGSCYLSNMEYLYMLIVSSSSLPSVLVAYLTCDRWGRIRTMFCSGCVVFVGITALLICINQYTMLAEACLVVFFSILQNCALWTFLPESYPTYIRNAAVGAVNGAGKVAAALGSLLTEVVAGSSIRICLLVYLLLTGYQLVCVYLMKRDTVGQALADTREEERRNERRNERREPPSELS